MQQVFVSIGSNIDPRNNIEEARIILGNLFDCTFSGLYETRAEGFEGNDFVRTVVWEFPSYKKALECHDSKEYQAGWSLAKDTTLRHMQIVEGFSTE